PPRGRPRCPKLRTPPQVKPQASAAAPRVLSLETVMVLSPPLASEITAAAAEAASVARPPANPRDTRTVALSRPAGNAAVARGVSPVASKAAEGARPRQTNRPRNRPRARDSLDRIVPLGQPIRRAASSVDRPSR